MKQKNIFHVHLNIHSPAFDPVLIQSGWAKLATAKTSDITKSTPDIIVNLSIL